MPPTDVALVAGATLRLTRLVTTDTLGDHYIVQPLDRLGHRHDVPNWVRDGLECPFCVGTWIGYATLGTYAVARAHPATLAAWRFVAAGLTLNYVVGHVSSRLDG